MLSSLFALSRGAPQQNYNYDAPATPVSYQFAYEVNAADPYSNTVNYGHSEGREGDITRGEYFVLLPDTRIMRVSYYSDATGFHPTYTYEGTAQFPQASAPAAPVHGQGVLSSPGAGRPSNNYNTPNQQFQAVQSPAIIPQQPSRPASINRPQTTFQQQTPSVAQPNLGGFQGIPLPTSIPSNDIAINQQAVLSNAQQPAQNYDIPNQQFQAALSNAVASSQIYTAPTGK